MNYIRWYLFLSFSSQKKDYANAYCQERPSDKEQWIQALWLGIRTFFFGLFQNILRKVYWLVLLYRLRLLLLDLSFMSHLNFNLLSAYNIFNLSNYFLRFWRLLNNIIDLLFNFGGILLNISQRCIEGLLNMRHSFNI